MRNETQKKLVEIIKTCGETMSEKEICEKFHISIKYLQEVAKSMGVKLITKKEMEIRKIATMLQEGKTVGKIVKELGVSAFSVNSVNNKLLAGAIKVPVTQNIKPVVEQPQEHTFLSASRNGERKLRAIEKALRGENLHELDRNRLEKEAQYWRIELGMEEKKQVVRVSEPFTQTGSPFGMADALRGIKIKN